MNYFVMKAGMRDGYAVVHELHGGLDDSDALTRGESAIASFRSDAFFQVPPEFKKNQKMPDALSAFGGHLVVGARVKDALVPLVGASRVEFLPVRIKNIAGQFLEDPYYIVHPLDILDVIDVEASAGEYNEITPDSLMSVEQLVLRDCEAEIFRPAHWEKNILVREDLAAKLKAHGFVGLSLIEADDFMG